MAAWKHLLVRFFFIQFLFCVDTKTAISHEFAINDLIIEHPIIRIVEPSGKRAAGYVEIYNKGTKTKKLTGATLEGANKAEFYYSLNQSEDYPMQRITDGLEIRPGERLSLNAKKQFIFFSDIFRQFDEDTYISGSLIFNDTGSIKIEYLVVAPKDNIQK